MGIVVRHRKSGKLMFYVKGADVAMIPKVKPGQRDVCQEYCENLAMEGLRTLVITHKLITESQYTLFEKNLKQAKASMQNREESILSVIAGLEDEMDFLAVTGVEDKLQEDVLVTIETLRQAGIQVWMLTGDKIETAKCIAIATGLKSKKESIFEMCDKDTKKDLKEVADISEAIVQF
jgi:phospholipid-translocating ATPase